MRHSQFHLLKTKRFLPLFITQFLGAFNDNLFKNALVILMTYRTMADAGDSQFLTTIAAGIFILPFFLFSATAGQFADKYEKTILIRVVKAFEIVFMLTAIIGFYRHSLWLLLSTLFLMGTHSAFFGPVKYAILPEQLRRDELIAGNALIEAATFVAILLGTVVGGIFILSNAGILMVSSLAVTTAVLGFIASLYIDRHAGEAPALKINPNFLQETWQIVQYARKEKDVFLSMLGISWFWFVGAIFLAQFPNFTKNELHANSGVITLFLAIFSVGIVAGSLFCNRLLHSRINATYVPFGILGMSLFMFDIYGATQGTLQSTSQSVLFSVSAFLSTLTGWRILTDMLLIAFCGGIFVVPLYAIMQVRTPKEHRARAIACNNILNSLFMVISALACMALLEFNWSVSEIFLVVGIVNAFVAVYICRIIPEAVIKSFVRWLLQLCFRVKIEGLEHYEQAGERMIIIANHTSYLDVVLLAAYLPDRLSFAINTYIAELWWMRPLLMLVETFKINPANPMAMKSLINVVRKNRRCVIFPEGRITATGALMKVYEGPARVAEKANAAILPVRIDGAQYTIFSRLRGKVRIRLFPEISLKILPAQRLTFESGADQRKHRGTVSLKFYDMMTRMIFDSSEYNKTLFESLIEARTIHGGRTIIVDDIQRKGVSYNRFIQGSFVLGEHVRQHSEKKAVIGVLLPNMASTAVLFFAIQLYGRVAAMLNHSAGVANVVMACETAEIKIVYTSRRFIEAAALQNMAKAIENQKIKVIYLEDVREEITFPKKLQGILRSMVAGWIYRKSNPEIKPTDPAVILFTSGSEGKPKGVVLSHKNIQANQYQLSSVVDITPQDLIFNALPMFHSFGLTAGAVLPILSGVKIFLYPSPLHYRIVPEVVYDYNATILFGTDTFLSGYARYAHPYDFYSIRYIFAGAERLKPETVRLWSEKFGIRIFEGYGTTEASPVLATNTPMQCKVGTVGRFIPGIEYRLEPVSGVEIGGRLYVKGPNIMLGYLRHDAPGQLDAPPDGWYDTGDIVMIDSQKYIRIVGRVKRFAKIGGEMVSLNAVEESIASLWPEQQHAVISLPDPRKGEQLVLLTEYMHSTKEAIIHHFKKLGLPEISIPKIILQIQQIPLLGSGKINYPAATEIANSSQ